MKTVRLLCLSIAALLSATTAEASKKWDFTNWSADTKATFLKTSFGVAGTITPTGGWSDVEKSNGTAPTETSKENCYWSFAQNVDTEGNLLCDGTIIAETKGLRFNGEYAAKRNLAIAFNYPKALNDYAGPSYLWLGGGSNTCFYIPGVKAGAKISMKVESHKSADTAGRGVKLYLNNTSGTQLKDPDGNDVVVPVTWAEQQWLVPKDATDTPNEDGTFDIAVYNTNGCHIYYIEVNDGDDVQQAARIAYLFDGTYNGAKDADSNPVGYTANGGYESDPVYTSLMDGFDVTPIDFSAEDIKAMTTEAFNDSLSTYDAVVLSEAVSSKNSLANGMKAIINRVPMLNLKAFMYGKWGFGAGANPSPVATSIVVPEAARTNALFEEIEIAEDGTIELFTSNEIAGGNLVQGYTVKAGALFEDDEVLATVDGKNAIHAHGKRNIYMLIPMSSDNLSLSGIWNVTDDALKLINNAVKILSVSKAKVTPAAAPAIVQTAKDGETVVTITCATSDAKVYYTLDGTEPTAASTLYAEPFSVTKDSTVVKAYAEATGYDPSAISSAVISVKTQEAAPSIAYVEEDGIATITLTGKVGDKICFNTSGAVTEASSNVYAAPFSVSRNCTITAFVAGTDSTLQSETAVLAIEITGYKPLGETIAHFDASKSTWSLGESKTKYYFGKNGYASFTTEIDSTITLKDMEGNDSLTINYYHPKDSLETVAPANAGWSVNTYGQVCTWENTSPLHKAGDISNYNPETLDDDLDNEITSGEITFGKITADADGVSHGSNAFILSTEALQGPFQVITYISGKEGKTAGISVSADGNTWTEIGDVRCGNVADDSKGRVWKRSQVGYAGTDKVYIKFAPKTTSTFRLFDIFVKEWDGVTAIENVNANPNANLNSIFDLQGRKVVKAVAGGLYIQNGKKVIVK